MRSFGPRPYFHSPAHPDSLLSFELLFFLSCCWGSRKFFVLFSTVLILSQLIYLPVFCLQNNIPESGCHLQTGLLSLIFVAFISNWVLLLFFASHLFTFRKQANVIFLNQRWVISFPTVLRNFSIFHSHYLSIIIVHHSISSSSIMSAFHSFIHSVMWFKKSKISLNMIIHKYILQDWF